MYNPFKLYYWYESCYVTKADLNYWVKKADVENIFFLQTFWGCFRQGFVYVLFTKRRKTSNTVVMPHLISLD